jgi:RHH-type rel operon transcriptional repressor/antitoxin RelB
MQLSIRLKEPVIQRLENLAKRTGRSKTFYVIEAINEHLEDLEDIYIAEQILENIHSGESKIISHKEVKKRYGL